MSEQILPNEYENGVHAYVVDGWLFPVGIIYNGVIEIDGERVHRTKSYKTADECRMELLSVIDGLLATFRNNVSRLETMKEKLEKDNEQV